MLQQLRFFWADYKRMAGRRKVRYLYIWLSRPVVGVWIYRFERSMYLTFGKAWKFLRIPFVPLLNLVYAYGNCEISYEANVGPGISVLHGSLGVVVSRASIIGARLRLTGGNTIGLNANKSSEGKIIIGDNCMLGANAVVIGPVRLGNNVSVGACACVVKDTPDNAVLGGVPAREI